MSAPKLLDRLRAKQARVLAPEVVNRERTEALLLDTQSTLCPVPDSDHGSEEAARSAQAVGVMAMCPDAQRVRGGWLIAGAHHDHDNAVRLAAQMRGSTTNGYPLSIDAGAVYREAQSEGEPNG
jgi:hypothetical protein